MPVCVTWRQCYCSLPATLSRKKQQSNVECRCASHFDSGQQKKPLCTAASAIIPKCWLARSPFSYAASKQICSHVFALIGASIPFQCKSQVGQMALKDDYLTNVKGNFRCSAKSAPPQARPQASCWLFVWIPSHQQIGSEYRGTVVFHKVCALPCLQVG